MKTYEEYHRWATLTDALLDLGMQNYYDHKPDSQAWRVRQLAIGLLQRELIEIRADVIHLPRSSFMLQPVRGAERL